MQWLRSTVTYEESSRARAIVELSVPVDQVALCLVPFLVDNIAESPELEPAPTLVSKEIFDISPVSNPDEEPKLLNEDELAEIRVFKLTVYKEEVLPRQVQRPQLVCTAWGQH